MLNVIIIGGSVVAAVVISLVCCLSVSGKDGTATWAVARPGASTKGLLGPFP